LLSIGILLGKLGGGSYSRDLERWIRQVSLSVGALLENLGRGGLSTGNFENQPKEGRRIRPYCTTEQQEGESRVAVTVVYCWRRVLGTRRSEGDCNCGIALRGAQKRICGAL